MSATALDLGEYDFPTRNRLAMDTIDRYARRHAKADAVIGLGGFLPVPGAAAASILAALALQVPMHKGLAADLGRIYSAPVKDRGAAGIVTSGIMLDSAATLGADVIVNQFGSDFLSQLGGEIMGEIGIGLGLSFIPFFGGFVAMGLDVAIAVTMSWRVGTMVSVYYQNGERWPEGRHETYEFAKGMTGGVSPQSSDRVNLNEIPQKHKGVFKYQVEQLMRFVNTLLKFAPDMTDAKIRQALMEERGVPKEIADEVIKRVRAGS